MIVPYIEVLLFIFFLILLGLLSALERALTGIGRHRATHLGEENPGSERAFRLWATDPNQMLAAIVFGEAFATIGVAVAVTFLAIGVAPALALPQWASVVIFSMLASLVVIVFGIVIPRVMAVRSPERMAIRLIRLAHLSHKVVFPFVGLLIRSGNAIARVPGDKPSGEGLFVVETDMRDLVAENEQGEIEEQERDMLHSIFELGDTVVREVMVPRPDAKCISEDAALDEALEVMVGGGFSRVPMYREDLDNIIGVLYAKDLLRYVGRGRKDISLRELARPAYFVPETKKIDELLRELQKKKIHLAVVVDEYGGTAGLITIEDLLEEIVGEIFDEYDLEEAMVEPIDENTIRLDARYPFDDLSELLGVSFPENADVDTVGGFVFSLIGKVPDAGERTEYNGLTFVVEKILGRRIRKILVKKTPGAHSAQKAGE